MSDKRFVERDAAGAVGNEVSGWVGGSMVQAGVVHGDVHLHDGHALRAEVMVVPRQLPTAAPHFVGRKAQIEALTGLMERHTARGRTVVISAIAGTAGIGKTALAVHWAHQVADRFPDGQLYVNLRGFDPTGSSVAPAEAVRGFLDAFAVPPERIPTSLDAQAALYRSLMAGRRALVVLDNARDVDQVRPLLPGSAGCLVVVTSRNRLTSLITAEGAHPLTLDLLTPAEACDLLTRRLAADRVSAEPQPVREIITLCARLPLALSIVAARAATHPGFLLATLAGELREAQDRLDVFDDGDLGGFNWSSQHLDDGGVDGQACGMDGGVDGPVSDEVAWGPGASAGGRACVLV